MYVGDLKLNTAILGHSGRRLRAFARGLISYGAGAWRFAEIDASPLIHIPEGEPNTYSTAFRLAWEHEGVREILAALPLARMIHQNPELPTFLQDLADEIVMDITEACGALDNPDHYYPGMEPGMMAPVTDDHIKVVIPALQRELNRELRGPVNRNVFPWAGGVLPAVPLDRLPWRVQRALVERRRFRYLQWGITRTEWQENRWSLWKVPEDREWIPRGNFS